MRRKNRRQDLKRKISPYPFSWWPPLREVDAPKWIAGDKYLHAMCGEGIRIRRSTRKETVRIDAHDCPAVKERSGLIMNYGGLVSIPAKDLVTTPEEVILWHLRHLK